MQIFEPKLSTPQNAQVFFHFTPLQMDVIKFLALLLMVVDHGSRTLGLNSEPLMLLGRGAFPLFGLIWGYNLARTKSVTQIQATRLWLWALFAQPFFWFALRNNGISWDAGNILFAFAVVTQAIGFWQTPTRKGEPNWKMVAGGVIALWCVYFSQSSYGVPGAVMLIASYLLFADVSAKARGVAILIWPFAVILMNLAMGWVAMIAGLVLSLAILFCSLPLYQPDNPNNRRRLFKGGFFVQFYVVHLGVLGAAALLVH